LYKTYHLKIDGFEDDSFPSGTISAYFHGRLLLVFRGSTENINLIALEPCHALGTNICPVICKQKKEPPVRHVTTADTSYQLTAAMIGDFDSVCSWANYDNNHWGM